MNIINSIHKYKQPGRSWYQRNVSMIKKIVVHHTASRQLGGTDHEQLQAEANHHINTNGWPGLSYTFVILPNGHIHQINNFSDVTWTDGINWDCVAICLKGYFHDPYFEKPTSEQVAALKWLLDNLSTQHPEFPAAKGDVYGHRDRAQTACPGNNLYPYPTEYREKNGNVSWGESPTPEPPPTGGVMKPKDQDLFYIDDIEPSKEWQAIRSTVIDARNPSTPPPPANDDRKKLDEIHEISKPV